MQEDIKSPSKEVKMEICVFCGKGCLSTATLKQHILTDHKPNSYKCEKDECDKMFKTKYICWIMWMLFIWRENCLHSKGNTALHETLTLGPSAIKVIDALLAYVCLFFKYNYEIERLMMNVFIFTLICKIQFVIDYHRCWRKDQPSESTCKSLPIRDVMYWWSCMHS